MNSIDLKNIKSVIKYREAVENGPDFDSNKATFTLEDLKNRSIDDLKQMVFDFENQKKQLTVNAFKKQVDQIFEKWGKPEDNMIVLSAAHMFDNYCDEIDDPLEDIAFDADYNEENIHPVGCSFDGISYWQRSEASDEELKEWDDVLEDFYTDIDKLLKAADKAKVKSAGQYWETEGDLSELNEIWYGVIAVKRNYEIVAFVIRNDGLNSDDEPWTIAQL